MIFFGSDIPNETGSLRGRLAPSPTGFLHLGNAWSFWLAWLGARAGNGELVLRFEDIDPVRSRREYAEAVIRDLSWLGLDWDYGPKCGADIDAEPAFSQSSRTKTYQDALEALHARGLVYPCYCTRKELRDIAGAPHVDDAGAPYPGICRNLSAADRERFEAAGRRPAMRLFCPEKSAWLMEDAIQGKRSMTLADCGGDFALRRSDGVFAYQLAVVVDDIGMGITQVIRGMDILTSTPRQMYLYSLCGVSPPRYAHLPLLTDCEGGRLAKRHASLTLGALREAGVQPQTLLGWLAAASGLRGEFSPMHAREGIDGFAFASITAGELRLPPDPAAVFLAAQKKR